MSEKYDFGGYATKNDLKCMDGRTIRKDAFKECDGLEVPLVWGHKHGSPSDVLGHAVLENRDDGVYTYGKFNNTDSGRNAKELVRNGDVRALSIYANQLVQKGGDVIHGMIREVSLCLAGANPGARIEELSLEHSADEDSDDFDALLFNGKNLEVVSEPEDKLAHAEKEPEETKEPKEETKPKEEEKTMAENKEKTVQDVINSMSEEQKNVMYFMIGKALEDAGAVDSEEEETEVSHNVFENDNKNNSLSHAAAMEAMRTILADAPKYGSLKKSFEAHQNDGILMHDADPSDMDVPGGSVTYGINGIDYLFPEARTLSNEPEFIKRDTDWVDTFLAGVKKNPFSRIKTVLANITEDDARAKGYVKAAAKTDEFIGLMKRITTPQTIYKKQKFDRDDIIDITDMNVVAWIKSEMRMMLNEEIARASLIGDGRSIASPDKIQEANIRPIVSDNDYFTIKQTVKKGSDDEETAKNAIKAALRARIQYRGSGNPTFFCSENWLMNMLLVEDSIGRRLYDTEASLAAALRARNIVTVPVMDGYTDAMGKELIGIFVNLNDYVIGTDKGGEVNMFDDFDIDYNQFKYLIETRCSGCLVKPYSAIALFAASSSTTT